MTQENTHWGTCARRNGGACDCSYPADAAGDDVKRACPECEGEGVVLVDFHYGTVEIECADCNATGATA